MGSRKVICGIETIDERVIHIHGDLDDVFLSKYQTMYNCQRRTHILILSKYKWLNAHLPEIILS
jgi:hypothetical protein